MSAIPLPPIWQPRRGAWWRLPWRNPLELLAGHLQYGSSSGHLKRAASGHLSHTCGAGTGCHCDKATARVVLSGLTTCCIADGSFPGRSSTLSGDPNGTWDVPFSFYSSPVCTYSLDTGLKHRVYIDNNTCDPAYFFAEYAWILNVTVTYFLGTLTYRVRDQGYAVGPAVFDGTDSPATDCGSVTITNTFTSCSYTGPVAYGGTAAVTLI